MRGSSWVRALLPVVWLACGGSDRGVPNGSAQDAGGDVHRDAGANTTGAREPGQDGGGRGGSGGGAGGSSGKSPAVGVSGGGQGGSAGTGTGGAAPDDGSPVHDDLPVIFDPMYSAFDGQHAFRVPAIVAGTAGLAWSARPADAVRIEADSRTGGAIITAQRAGDVEIIVRAGALSGSAMLHITASTPELWAIGERRYRSPIAFDLSQMPAGGAVQLPSDLSCHGCHGSGAEALDVEHTPQQTGGYSDDQLIALITSGSKPPGSWFHTPLPSALVAFFHTWKATAEEQRGLVTYMRSLAPVSQGPLDFHGRSAGTPITPADAGLTGGSGGSDATGTERVACGTTQCSALAGSPSPACCLDVFLSKCGVQIAGVCQQR